MQKWFESESEEIKQQISVFKLYVEQVKPSLEYQLEVHRNRCNDLELDAAKLRENLEYYKEQQAMFEIMSADLESYKEKAL